MSSSSSAPQTSQAQVPFAGHPLGGLEREDRFGAFAADGLSRDASADVAGSQSGSGGIVDEDASGGFDFHLGVYARF